MIFPTPLLPNEPRIPNPVSEQKLTDQYLTPALAELEAFFLAVRAQVDLVLQPRKPFKHGKPYPLGQCLEISQAVQERWRSADTTGMTQPALAGHAALTGFLRAGGTMRQVWGDLRGRFFQNAFLIGTLYVDTSNDTVVSTKPQVEILPFARSELIPVRDHRHYRRIAQGYWRDQVWPNHVLPEVAPYCPVIHISPSGAVRFNDISDYMLGVARADGFRSSEELLAEQPMPAELFERVAACLREGGMTPAAHPALGRRLALERCRSYRARRQHLSRSQQEAVLPVVGRANAQLNRLADSPSPSPHSMNQHIPVSIERHAHKRWLRVPDFRVAARDMVGALTVAELPQAALSLPVAFIADGDGFTLVAVQGLTAGRNLLVHPDGRWLAEYVPAAYRAYPFALASTDAQTWALCVDENGGRLAEGPLSEPFFDENQQPAPAMAAMLRDLRELAAGRQASAGVCAQLRRHGLLQPWPITVQAAEPFKLEGLYRIDEAALNALPAAALAELRDTGALVAAYCQLLSMRNLARLTAL